jgi:hypothetical protein
MRRAPLLPQSDQATPIEVIADLQEKNTVGFALTGDGQESPDMNLPAGRAMPERQTGIDRYPALSRLRAAKIAFAD